MNNRNLNKLNKSQLMEVAENAITQAKELNQRVDNLENTNNKNEQVIKDFSATVEELKKSMELQRQNRANPVLQPNQFNGFLAPAKSKQGKDVFTTQNANKRHVRINMNYKGQNIDTIMPIWMQLGKTVNDEWYFTGWIQEDNNNSDVTLIKTTASGNDSDFTENEEGEQKHIQKEKQIRNQTELDEINQNI